MKKRLILVSVLITCTILSLHAQEERAPGLRFDLGFDVPFTIGAVMEGSTYADSGYFTEVIIPFPSLNLNFMVPVGPLSLGGGLRGYSFIIETFMWPNLVAEMALGPLVLQAQLGGGIFGYFGLTNGIQKGAVFMPDLAVYYQYKKFRAGVGALGLFIEGIGDQVMPVIVYASVKFMFD